MPPQTRYKPLQTIKPISNVSYDLKFIQYALFGREYKSSKRLVVPQPILVLKLYHESHGTKIDITGNVLSQYFLKVTASQVNKEGKREPVELIGTDLVSSSLVDCQSHGLYFLFSFDSLAIRGKGNVDLKFHLFKQEFFGNSVSKCAMPAICYMGSIFAPCSVKIFGNREYYQMETTLEMRRLVRMALKDISRNASLLSYMADKAYSYSFLQLIDKTNSNLSKYNIKDRIEIPNNTHNKRLNDLKKKSAVKRKTKSVRRGSKNSKYCSPGPRSAPASLPTPTVEIQSSQPFENPNPQLFNWDPVSFEMTSCTTPPSRSDSIYPSVCVESSPVHHPGASESSKAVMFDSAYGGFLDSSFQPPKYPHPDNLSVSSMHSAHSPSSVSPDSSFSAVEALPFNVPPYGNSFANAAREALYAPEHANTVPETFVPDWLNLQNLYSVEFVGNSQDVYSNEIQNFGDQAQWPTYNFN